MGLHRFMKAALAVAITNTCVALSQSVDPASFAESTFDIIIAGGGTAGLVLANRLSATSLRVGVIDAGHYNTAGDPLIDVPFSPGSLIDNPSAAAIGNPNYDWGFSSVPQIGLLNGLVIAYPRGKVLGGSSAINNMAWQRGARAEYDSWGTTLGNGAKWTFDALEPCFKRAENWTFPATGVEALVPGTTANQFLPLASVHGKGGHIHARYDTFVTDLDRAFAAASDALGFPLNPNPDNGNTTFIPLAGIADSVDISTGKRSYAAPGYYNADVRSRKNLVVLMGAVVSRIVWDNNSSGKTGNGTIRARGVEYIVGNKTYVVNATREVIVSEGTLKSPQLFELSGVGNATLLKSLGIPVTLDLPQIGENLMDHLLTATDYSVKKGVLTLDWLTNNATFLAEQQKLYNTTGAGAFTYATRVTGSWPVKDLVSTDEFTTMRAALDAELANMTLTPLQSAQYNVLKTLVDSGEIGWVTPIALPRGGVVSTPANNTNYVTLAAFQMHEFSRGSVHINTTDPNAAPVIDPKFMSLNWDLDVQVAGTKFLRKWAGAEPASSYIDQASTPPASVQSDDDWAKFVLSTLASIAHPIGTMAMASQNLGGVVSPRLKVYGLDNVRVVDASIIPLTVGAPIQPTVYALAENAAIMIAQDLGVSQGLQQC